MKLSAFLLLSLLIVQTVCAEQRLSDLEPGVPCSKIPEIEKRLGSVELAARNAKGISVYAGVQGGEKATIVYHCDKERLTEQKIIITSTTRDEAYRLANEQKIKLTKLLGEPIHDGLDLNIWKRLYFAFVGSDLDYLTRVVVWGRAKEDTMLLLKEKGPNLWEVSISRGSSKLEYILNS